MENLFDDELNKQLEEEAKAKKLAEQEKKKQAAEEKKAEQDRLKKEKEERTNYTFTTVGDVKSVLERFLEEETKTDEYFKTMFIKDKMDLCYSWLVEQIKNAYVKANGQKNGGIDISTEQCFMACKHFFNEELWKYLETPKEEKKADSKPKEKKPEQLSLDFDFGTNEEEHQEEEQEDYSQFENGDELDETFEEED